MFKSCEQVSHLLNREVSMSNTNLSVGFALLAALLYAINVPFSKLLLNELAPTMTAAYLYLGAGIGMSALWLIRKRNIRREKALAKQELPYIFGMIVLDIFAPIFLLIGLKHTTAANASLLNNFEIVVTSVIALVIFKEAISKRLWIAIAFITISTMVLSIEDINSLSLSLGSIFILVACVCWGLENNCTRVLARKDPLQIVIIKGFGSGLGALVIALKIGEPLGDIRFILMTLFLGFMSYGLSIFFYVYAQRDLGAAKTSAFYAVSPFIGTALSLMVFSELPTTNFILALAIMIIGAYLASTD